MSNPTTSGIQTSVDGQSFIPSSKRPDGSTRKEIRIRPGYKPPEDVATYKSRNAESWRTRGAVIPGAESLPVTEDATGENKSKNAKRREAARKKKVIDFDFESTSTGIENNVAGLNVDDAVTDFQATAGEIEMPAADEGGLVRQKKIRNHLKKLKAVHDLKVKKTSGDKLSADQLVKISKEGEIIRDLMKLNYNGPEMDSHAAPALETPSPD